MTVKPYYSWGQNAFNANFVIETISSVSYVTLNMDQTHFFVQLQLHASNT